MDFCIGTVAFYLLGYNLLCGEGGFVGWGLNPFTGFGETDWSGYNLINRMQLYQYRNPLSFSS